MRAVDLIRCKRDGGSLGLDAVREFVEGVTDGSWPDYQVAAMLMAIAIRGMTFDEAAMLTDAMVRSGVTVDLSDLRAVPVDKHSTGGVGDKASLVLAPLAAACGAVVPMMSGRGLGHTGGTLDKLESIPGFRTGLSLAEMRRVLDEHGCALIGQTSEIAPADRRMYALRDVTGSVESVPLIAASILSKKIAEGIRALVIDVKVGRGAFMKTLADARELANWLTAIAARNGVVSEAWITPMNAPLGRAVGNANEVIEAVETLKGQGPEDLTTLSVQLAAAMLRLAGISPDQDEAERRVRRALERGDGLEKFRDIVRAQGGDPAVLDDYSLLPKAQDESVWVAPSDGFVAQLDAERIGMAAMVLGAGRERFDATIHPGVGLEVVAPVGSPVRLGDPVIRIMYDDMARFERASRLLDDAVTIAAVAPRSEPPVLEVIVGPALDRPSMSR